MKPVEKILIIKLRAIGDVLLSTPVIANLRSHFPGSEIHFLVETPGKAILSGNPGLDRIVELPLSLWRNLPFLESWKNHIQFLLKLRREKYDIVLDLFGNPRSAWITWFSGARIRAGFAFRIRKLAYNVKVPPRPDRVHEVEFNLDALRALGIPVHVHSPQFKFTDEEHLRMKKWLAGFDGKKRIGMHVWGGWPSKRWPIGKFALLAQRLGREYDAVSIVVWGPGEKEYGEQVCRMSGGYAVLTQETSLGELGALFSMCDLVIACDSGPMHLSAAVGTPTLGIFGPTRWDLQGPYGSGHRVVYKKELECLGCNRTQCDRCLCMENLEVDEVMNAASGMLKPVRSRAVKSSRRGQGNLPAKIRS